MMKVAGKAAKNTGKKAAKKTGKKVAKKQAKKVAKKQAKKVAKKQAKKVAKKQAKKVAKKQAKKVAKKQAKKQVKKKAKKKVKKKAKKKVQKKAKKKVKKKAKKKVQKKAKKKVKSKVTKKVKKKAKKKIQEEFEEMMEDMKDDAMDMLQDTATDFIQGQLQARLGDGLQEAGESYSSSSDEDDRGKQTVKDKRHKTKGRRPVKIFEPGEPDGDRPGLIGLIFKTVFFIIWKILTCCCWLLCKCLRRVFRDRTPAEAKCCWKWMCVPGSYPNLLFKRIVGFFSGCLLTFLFYLIFIFVIGHGWKRAVTTSSILGFIFCFGLAFSSRVRCIVLLMLPQFFTGKGRVILLAYGYILLLGGPLANLTYNLDAASQAQACGSALAMNQSSTIFEIVTAPLSDVSRLRQRPGCEPVVDYLCNRHCSSLQGIVDDVKEMIESVRKIVARAHDAFMALVDAVKAIGDAIQAFFDWMETMVDRCNERMGRPRDICYQKFEDGERKCRAKGLTVMCNIVDLTSNLCELAAMGQLLCYIPLVVNLIVDKVTEGFEVAVDKLEKQFYVDFEFTHEFSLNRNFSKTPEDIKDAMIAEIGGRTSNIRTVLYWVTYCLSFTVIFLFFKAMKYRSKYLTKDLFDNVYITDPFVRLEEKRRAKKKFTLFPLSDREARRYIRPYSLRLARSERRKMVTGLVMWFYQAGYALMLIFSDISAFSFLTVVREKVEMSVKQGLPGTVHLIVQGEGLLSDVYRVLVKALDPSTHANITIDTTKCLPSPNPPDIFSYYQIGGIYLLCLLLVLSESYGRRLRRVAAAYYYPEREKFRIVFLYNHIMKRRGGLVEALRMKFQKHGPDKTQEDIGIRSTLASRFFICRFILGCCGYERKFCLECGLPGKPSNHTNFRNCGTPDCEAVYCLECIAEISNMCTLCMGPVEYIEFSDFSEEKDSSDEEYGMRRKKHISYDSYHEDDDEDQYLLSNTQEIDDDVELGYDVGDDVELGYDIQMHQYYDEEFEANNFNDDYNYEYHENDFNEDFEFEGGIDEGEYEGGEDDEEWEELDDEYYDHEY